MTIRKATQADIPQVANLVNSLAHFYLEEGRLDLPNWFSNTLSHSAFAQRFKSPDFMNFIYEEADTVAGYIALRNNQHLYHLFVSSTHQRKGIARQLWQHVKALSGSDHFTLRSSLYAVPVYAKLGFKICGNVGCKDGIGFQPMELFI